MNHRATAGVVLAFAALTSEPAQAFQHVVRPGETLAQIAERLYGDAKLESVLVGANGLDAQGGAVIVPGMRLQVPTAGFHTIRKGDSWADLATEWLGTNDEARVTLLATANKSVPWIPPTEGQEIEIPAVVTYIAGDGETVNSIAGRFWKDESRGWELNKYNGRPPALVPVKRGEVILVPLPHLRLTEMGMEDARAAAERDGALGTGALERQQRADTDLPLLSEDVRAGRYTQAVARGNRLLGAGSLTRPQLAAIHRALLEAYVALDEPAAAAGACAAWKMNEAAGALDPVRVSPKIIRACEAR
jgi:hypothetical protein